MINAGLIPKYTFEYTDANRANLSKSKDGHELLTMLPDDDTLLQNFVNYAQKNGVAPRWYYINLSRDLIVSLVKGLIARDVLGTSGYYEIMNASDPTVNKARKEIESGNARYPIGTPANNNQKKK